MGADGRVEIRYRETDGAKRYRAAAGNLGPAPEGGASPPVELEDGPEVHPDGAVLIYTDGACTGNPGPMGIGVVVLDGARRVEKSEFLGRGTNNIAELTAVERALDALPDEARGRPILLHSDSSYAIGVLAKSWKAKANTELVARLRRRLRDFPALRFVKVEGHAGVPENERCDELARQAIRQGGRP